MVRVDRQDPIDYLFGLEQYGIKLGLENIGHLCQALDHPEHTFDSVIVAGTNGKGSVAAMLEAALRHTGLQTGCFTSPHLVDLTERFAIQGRPVPRTALAEQAEILRETVGGLLAAGTLDAPPTFFEATTALAFLLFRQAGIEIAVLEVGMGGRFDATNIVTPIAAAITTIDMDHQQYLGHTLEKIAFEKAGVIKTGQVVVTGETQPAALAVLRRVCQERGARLVEALTDTSTEVTVRNGMTVLSLTTPSRTYPSATLSLRGHHQVTNARVAVRLLEELELEVPVSAIHTALSDTAWPGRIELFEVADRERVVTVVLDAAHNVAAARALARYLTDEFPAGVALVLAAMRDKDVRGMLEVLRPCVTHVYCPSLGNRRAWPSDDLADTVSQAWPAVPVTVAESPEAALQAARQVADTVCVAGSIYLVGEVRSTLGPIASPGRVLSRAPE